jgi:hypothetical protein
VQGFIIHRLTKAPPLIITSLHGMGSGSALRLSGMTKRWRWFDNFRAKSLTQNECSNFNK